MSDALEANIAQLRRHFGNQLDRDALEAVLAVNDNDVSRAIAFLTATGTGVYVFNPAQENSLPSDYPGQTKQLGYKAPPVKLPPISDLKPLFLKDSTLLEHFNSQKTEYYIYTSTLLLLMHQCVEITRACRPKILASAWARRDYHLAEYLLTKEDYFQLPQVLAALNLLDAPRKVRQLRPKLAALEKLGTAKPAKIGLLRSRLHDLELEAPIGSLSGSLAKHVRKWVCSIPANKLMFYALVMPREPWQELADMIHLHPLRDFQPLQKPEVSLLPPPITTSPTASPTAVIPPTALVRSVGKQHGNFLNIAFGEAPPEASIFKVCENVNVHNIADVCSRFEVPYSFLRLHVKPIPDDVKPRIAEYTTLDQLIWYYEELANPEVDRVLLDRLRSGEEPQLGYGKLMERLLYFRTVSAPFTEYLLPIAERRLKEIQLVLEPPVVCAGDASYSMDVAIRCSTIIGSVLSCLTNAELKFFNDKVLDPPVIPRTISQVLDVTSSVRADGLTAPGCVIWNYLTNRRPIKFLIMVTDEIENVKFRDSFFPTLFMKYKREIAPDCTLVFVSFLENPAVKGRMVSALENMGIVPIQFKLDGARPDLTKLDSLLGLLASESSHFYVQVQRLTTVLEKGGLKVACEFMKKPIPLPPHKEVTPVPVPTGRGKGGKGRGRGAASPTKPTASPTPAETPAATADDGSRDGGSCVVCLDKQADTAVLDCGHLSFCEDCAKALVGKQCPMCRQPVLRTVRIFKSTS